MISIQQAQNIIWNEAKVLGTEKVNILKSIERVLAENIIAPFDMPLFDRAAMDGYAIKFDNFKDLKVPFIVDVAGEIKAGEKKKIKFQENKAVMIMTGAGIPEGFDTVIKFEDTEKIEEGKKIKILKEIKKGENVSKKGEDFKKGDILVEKGQIIDPAVLAIIAYTGKKEVLVYKKPQVGIVATGDEIKKIGMKLKEGEIYDCNSYSIYGLVLRYGGKPEILGIAKDNEKSLRRYIEKGIKKDILILSGGVSEGRYDIVVKVLKELGVVMNFWKVAVKPGKPTFFGKKDNCLIFGLPGYPVSTYINFENLVRVAILKMTGQKNFERFKIYGILTEDVENKGDRDEFLRVKVIAENGENLVIPFHKQKSGIFTSITNTNGLLFLKKGEKIKKGEKVLIQIYRPFSNLGGWQVQGNQ